MSTTTFFVSVYLTISLFHLQFGGIFLRDTEFLFDSFMFSFCLLVLLSAIFFMPHAFQPYYFFFLIRRMLLIISLVVSIDWIIFLSLHSGLSLWPSAVWLDVHRYNGLCVSSAWSLLKFLDMSIKFLLSKLWSL